MTTHSLKVLPLKTGVGQYIAMHATLTARDFFPANFYPSGPFTCMFPKTSRVFFPVLAVADTGSCVDPQNKIFFPFASICLSHSSPTLSLKVLPLKPGVGKCIVMHATLTARDLFLTYFYPSGPCTSIFFQNLSWFFPAFAVADTGSCVDPQNKMLDAGSLAECPRNINRPKTTWLVV